MQSVLESTVQKAGDAVSGGLSSNKKVKDLSDRMANPTSNSPITTDFGVKVLDTDHWLSASSNSTRGPALLEDGIGREKVNSTHIWKTSARELEANSLYSRL